MKKIILSLIFVLSCLLQVKAQSFVSVEPQKRNVLIEEFTGRNCQYCPDGQIIANAIQNAYPDKAFVVAIHAGSLSPMSYPNLNTDIGDMLDAGFTGSSRPSAVINRSTAEEQGRTTWSYEAGIQFEQDAEVNVGGIVVIDEASRHATIVVEAYYTGSSASENNYINVYMVQDSILGYQNGASTNPDQIVDGTYCHMHVLRSAVTPTWGDVMSPTTAGSFVRKTYSYDIPSTVGSPNAVTVDIDNVQFIAFVAEQYQGTPTRPVLNVNKLTKVQGSFGEVAPYIINAKQSDNISCSNESTFSANILNVGSETLESLKMNVKLDGEIVDVFTWEGSVEQFDAIPVELSLEMSSGEHELTLEIVEANQMALNVTNTIMAVANEAVLVETESDEMTLTIDVVQDKYGNQITWEILKSDMTVIASGGPYDMLTGSSATKLHRVNVNVPSDECIRFVIRDEEGNGICCNYGEGYYKIKGNNTVLIDGSGDFGAEASHNLNVVKTIGVEENVRNTYNIYPNPVKNTLNIKGENMNKIVVYNSLGQMVKSVSCDSDNMTIDVNTLNDGVYFINIIDDNGEISTNKVSVIR